LADMTVCGRCGARPWAGAIFCHACGASLRSNGPVGVSPGQPSRPFAPVPPAVSAVPPSFAPPLDPRGVSATPAAFGTPPAPPVAPPGLPYGAPPAGYNPSVPFGTGAARPIGLAILTVVEIVIGIVGLTVVVDLLYWANVSNYYQEAEAGLDLVMGLAYLATSVAGFAVARRLWSMRPEAWIQACLLSIVLIGFDVLSVFEWGVTGLDIIGLTVHLSVLAYLNLNSVRGLFGRPPTTFLQGPP
jgi:hypothetical protein